MLSKFAKLPARSGTYVLLLHLCAGRRLKIGKLGWLIFREGWYAYVGSAFGPGGLAARLGRHLRVVKNHHWHIDYLRAGCTVAGMWIAEDERRREHLWAGLLAQAPLSGEPIAGFGSTDCSCGSHLFYFAHRPRASAIAGCLDARWIAYGTQRQKEQIPMKSIIDSHLHLDLIHHDHPERIRWLRDHHCTVISWAFGPDIRTAEGLRGYLRHQKKLIGHIHRQTGLDCYYLTGIHPRSIPEDLDPRHVSRLLTPMLSDPLCLGIGEIGLEVGSAKEKEIFAAQLELALAMKVEAQVVGVHTPRSNKFETTRRTLEILNHYAELRPRLVVDHCSGETLGMVLEAGWQAGVTLSPPKTALSELSAMVNTRADAVQNIMCNTDSGTEFYEDLVSAAGSGQLPEHVKAAVFHDNAARFFFSNGVKSR